MDYTFAGLPLHVLLVHAVLVLTPLVGLALVVIAAWPAARRVLWLPVLIAAAVLLPLGLITIEAGKWLEVRVPPAPLIQEHTAKGEDIVPWLIALLVVAALVSAWAVIELVARRRDGGGRRTPSARSWHPDRRRHRAHARGARGDRRRDLDDRADRRVGQPRRVGGVVQRRAARAVSIAGARGSAATERERLAEVRFPRGPFALVDAARTLGRGVDAARSW